MSLRKPAATPQEREQNNFTALLETVDEIAENIKEYIDLIEEDQPDSEYGAAMKAARERMVKARRQLLAVKKNSAVRSYASNL